MQDEDVIKLLEQALREGMKFGRELETSKNKQLLPVAIGAVVKMRAQTILNQNKDEQ